MDQEGVQAEVDKTTPLFGAYRRGGYDPEQVDSYVAEQARRLEAAEHRASEAERRLAAAVGQLRELHRRVAVLESEDRSPQPQSLDTLGERVQRILKEAWEGAYALRQGAEQEVAELRARATGEAEEIVATAEARARQIDEEIDRRRKAYIARLEEDRARAVAQVSYLHEQRRVALTELLRVKEIIEETVGDAARPVPPEALDPPVSGVDVDDIETTDEEGPLPPAALAPGGGEAMASARTAALTADDDVPTVAVRSLGDLIEEPDEDEFDAAELQLQTDERDDETSGPARPGTGLVRRLPADDGEELEQPAEAIPGVFDFEEE